jgi:hypothetical protein
LPEPIKRSESHHAEKINKKTPLLYDQLGRNEAVHDFGKADAARPFGVSAMSNYIDLALCASLAK